MPVVQFPFHAFSQCRLGVSNTLNLHGSAIRVSLMLASSRVRIAASFAPMFQPRQVIRLWMMAMKYGWTTPVVLHSMYHQF